MKKPFLLIMGYSYYPSSGTGDWKGTYQSSEDAEGDVIKTGMFNDFYCLKGQLSSDRYDWYKIVDLRDWTE